MKNLSEIYTYEIELKNGTIITDSNNFSKDDVKRLSYIPTIPFLPRHDFIFDKIRFERRLGRVSMKYYKGVIEYLHICVTSTFRVYLFSSSGRTLITNKNYELYI